MKYVSLILVVLAIATFSSQLSSADPPNEDLQRHITPLMKMKLEKSKAILEGLTLEDFDAVSKNAKALKLLSLESGWNVLQTPEYVTQSQDFRRAADMIAEAATEKNISRATLGYVSMTVRCVECHSYMRKHRMTLN